MHCIGCEATAKPFVSAREDLVLDPIARLRTLPDGRTPQVSRRRDAIVCDYETGTTPGETACG